MVKFSATLEGAQALAAHYRRVPRIVRRATAKKLSYFGRRIVGGVKRDTTTFKGGKGGLQRSTWTKRKSGTGEAVQEMGWGAGGEHGPIMEWGTKKTEWPITPRGFRSDVKLGRSGGRQALRFLRFQVGNKIVYAKKVIHTWTKAQLRPHFGPVLDLYEPIIMRTMANIPIKAIEGRLG